MFSKSLRTAFVALTVLAVSISATQSLSVKLTGPEAVDSVEHLKIIATVTNTGDETLKVLNDPRGPLNKLPANTFMITNAKGSQPSFMGIQLKYVPEVAATLEGYSILAPGESVVVEHDIAQAYNFTASGPASYDIHARNTFYVVNADSTISTLLANVDPHSAKISGNLVVARPALFKRAKFNGCTASQKTEILEAAKEAHKYAVGAFNYASSHTSATPRYKTWFGAYKPARHDKVVSHFEAISSNTFRAYTYDCTCTDNSFAFVYPEEFGIVHLCKAFWEAKMLGTNSKAGTIVHEATHFTKNGGTDDIEYGVDDCKALARNKPASAVMNADSHEFFAENTPRLA